MAASFHQRTLAQTTSRCSPHERNSVLKVKAVLASGIIEAESPDGRITLCRLPQEVKIGNFLLAPVYEVNGLVVSKVRRVLDDARINRMMQVGIWPEEFYPENMLDDEKTDSYTPTIRTDLNNYTIHHIHPVASFLLHRGEDELEEQTRLRLYFSTSGKQCKANHEELCTNSAISCAMKFYSGVKPV
eukprot:CAMPEP_0196582898 /NCGR_PEP_ID=MMETSP1081-20130531/41204_1 /TAXON_ID=36882 /ORGANISM="Pyramimonas amylifera, Strain CCMP720" /LENGTH=186 /DNA_ID=CAMNT_0041903619 /DNA_START=176 /DNA_END=736 /DNA_ORIENTATION=-